MPILGCTSIEEAFALQQAEERRAGRRGEFYDHIRSIPMVPIFKNIPSKDEFLEGAIPMTHVKMLVHQAMPRPGKSCLSFFINYESKIAINFAKILFRHPSQQFHF